MVFIFGWKEIPLLFNKLSFIITFVVSLHLGHITFSEKNCIFRGKLFSLSISI
jgi:hypothetical protein